MKHRLRADVGFTLIELMVAVAVVGILAAIALPAYTQYILQSRRTDAKNGLLDLAARQERYYAVNNQYTSNPINLGYVGSSTFPINIMTSGAAYYALQLNVGTGTPNFTATAVPLGSQLKDACGTYSLDYTGVEGNAGGTLSPSACW